MIYGAWDRTALRGGSVQVPAGGYSHRSGRISVLVFAESDKSARLTYCATRDNLGLLFLRKLGNVSGGGD